MYKADQFRCTAQDGDKNPCAFTGEDVSFKLYASAAGGEEDREDQLTRISLQFSFLSMVSL
jgi:hypothetical protein